MAPVHALLNTLACSLKTPAYLLAFVVLATSAPVHAAKLQEIIVTAQKRAESLQDVSVSVTALSGEKLADFGIARLEEVTAYIPNFVMSETGIGTNIYIRGIGSGINQGFEQSVGMYRDGIYYGRAQLSRAPIFDMERVEVLRGPQVTLFGNNSIGGAISMSATKPTREFEGSFSYLGDFDHGEREANLILSGPLSETVGARLSVRRYDMDGYLFNETTQRDEPNRDYLTARLNFRFEPQDLDWLTAGLLIEHSTFDVLGRQIVVYQDIASTGVAASVTPTNFADGSRLEPLSELLRILPSVNEPVIDTNNLDVRFANNDFSLNETNNVTLTFDFAVGESELKSITGYLDYDFAEACDCDFTGADLIQYESDEAYDQISQEFRFTSGWDGWVEMIAGVYYQRDNLDFADALIAEPGTALEDFIEDLFTPTTAMLLTDLSAPRTFEQDAELFSGFTQFTFHFADNLRLMAGIRRSKTEKEAFRRLIYAETDRVTPLDTLRYTTATTNFGLGLQVTPHLEQGDRTEWRTSYSAIFEWDINEDVLLYASRVRGFKSGGFDVRSNNATVGENVIDETGTPFSSPPTSYTPGTFEFADEEALAHELGIKSSIGPALEINAAYFYTEIENLQVSEFDGGVGFNVTNAAKAVTQGIEIDWRWAITDEWMFNGSFGWLDFEYKDYTNAVCTSADRLAIAGGAPNVDFIETIDEGPTPSPFDNTNIRTLIDGNCERRQRSFQGAQFFADQTGNTNQYVAQYSGALSLNYETELQDKFLFRGTLDMNFTDDYHPTQNLDRSAEEGGYEIYNVRMSLANLDGGWEVVLLGRNILDKEVISYANDVPLATSQFGTISKYGFIQRTKSWALQARLTF